MSLPLPARAHSRLFTFLRSSIYLSLFLPPLLIRPTKILLLEIFSSPLPRRDLAYRSPASGQRCQRKRKQPFFLTSFIVTRHPRAPPFSIYIERLKASPFPLGSFVFPARVPLPSPGFPPRILGALSFHISSLFP